MSVLYWDDNEQRLASLDARILHVRERVAMVEDPQRVIGLGDSGSGVYNSQGELVGNVWSIVNTSTGERQPWIEFSLLPADIAQYVS